jgi:hypothetical protein
VLQRARRWRLHRAPKLIAEKHAGAERGSQSQERSYDAGTQFIQVLHERHPEHAYVVN